MMAESSRILAPSEKFPNDQKETPRISEVSQDTDHHKFIDCREFASRMGLPESWVREHVRERSEDPIPHGQFGKYVRFRWGSAELEAWIERRIVSGSNGKAGRALGKESR